MKNRKYKIAYCLVGIVGYTEPQGRGKPVDFRIAHKYNKENIFGDNDVDVFIHSWSTDFKDDLIKLYKPKNIFFKNKLSLMMILEKMQLKVDGILPINLYN